MSDSDPQTAAMLSKLEREGFAIVPGVLDDRLRLELLRDVERSFSPSVPGVRGLTRKIDNVERFARSTITLTCSPDDRY